MNMESTGGAEECPVEDHPQTKLNIVKNVLVLSLGFLLLFTAFQSTSNLQSSINAEEGLGFWSLCVIYTSLVAGCLFLPPVVISRLGLKWTVVASMCCYASYMAAHFYASFYTLLPTAFILGLGGSTLWTSKCSYLTLQARRYAALTGQPAEAIIAKFFGVFFMTFQSSQIWGNLISSFVLGSGIGETSNRSEVTNFTSRDTIQEYCGASFCGTGALEAENITIPNLSKPEESKIHTLFGIYLGCATLAAVFIALLLDPQEHRVNPEEPDEISLDTGGDATSSGDEYSGKDSEQKSQWQTKDQRGFSPKLLLATVSHLRHPSQVLLIPLTIFSGLEQGFILGDYTKAYVGCAWGIHMIGYVMITFGVTDTACSLATGRATQWLGRSPLFLAAAVCQAAAFATLLQWTPDVERPEDRVALFLLAAMWGASDAVWQTSINALYGTIFPHTEEAAFANYRLWESVGFIIAFACGDSVCVGAKLWVLLGFLLAGMLGYGMVQWKFAGKSAL